MRYVLSVFIVIVITCCLLALFFFVPAVSPVVYLNWAESGDINEYSAQDRTFFNIIISVFGGGVGAIVTWPHGKGNNILASVKGG